jgi:hypothetical protein
VLPQQSNSSKELVIWRNSWARFRFFWSVQISSWCSKALHSSFITKTRMNVRIDKKTRRPMAIVFVKALWRKEIMLLHVCSIMIDLEDSAYMVLHHLNISFFFLFSLHSSHCQPPPFGSFTRFSNFFEPSLGTGPTFRVSYYCLNQTWMCLLCSYNHFTHHKKNEYTSKEWFVTVNRIAINNDISTVRTCFFFAF